MLAHRLVRGRPGGPLLVAAFSAATAHLLLTAFDQALAAADRAGAAAAAPAWCLLPLAALAAVARLAAAAAEHRPEVSGPGLPPARRAAARTALPALLGSAAALPLHPPPLAVLPAALTLLAAPPLLATAAATAGAVLRLRRRTPGTRRTTPGGVPVRGRHGGRGARRAVVWGGAAGLGAGAALGAVRTGPAAVSWALIAAGLMAVTPGLLHAAGRAVAAGTPGAVRLLAGRSLQTEAARAGRSLGMLCAALALAGPLAGTPLGPAGTAVTVAATAAAAAPAVLPGIRHTALLHRLGAARRTRRSLVALRTAALLVLGSALIAVTTAVARPL
ncbi:hypothetical protein [Streptomyces aidingensis]|uniref:Uncharacterized protein n=1 Tax=Streptomyces aidingensis TaxID=910347 RepID=A0A1I1NV83_9ACTN|nr:hypothetical protein [Streptomyces aidingensis]SFD01306.1 hypothetical protein SAMN05421773_108177 [Streptomyces aidingensis]